MQHSSLNLVLHSRFIEGFVLGVLMVKTESLARVLQVTPSSINRIYKGETEPTVKFDERIRPLPYTITKQIENFLKYNQPLTTNTVGMIRFKFPITPSLDFLDYQYSDITNLSNCCTSRYLAYFSRDAYFHNSMDCMSNLFSRCYD